MENWYLRDKKAATFWGQNPIKLTISLWACLRMRCTTARERFQSGLSRMEGCLWWGRNLPPTAAALVSNFCGPTLSSDWKTPSQKQIPSYKVGFPDNALFLKGRKKKQQPKKSIGWLSFPAPLTFSYFPAFLQGFLWFAMITGKTPILLAVLT